MPSKGYYLIDIVYVYTISLIRRAVNGFLASLRVWRHGPRVRACGAAFRARLCRACFLSRLGDEKKTAETPRRQRPVGPTENSPGRKPWVGRPKSQPARGSRATEREPGAHDSTRAPRCSRSVHPCDVFSRHGPRELRQNLPHLVRGLTSMKPKN